MTVYVDDMKALFGRLIMCHMVAHTDEELHVMADKIGVDRKWFQGDHYDIALSKRAIALKNGAVSITLRQCGMLMAVKRRTGVMPTMEEAQAFHKERTDAMRLRLQQQGFTP